MTRYAKTMSQGPIAEMKTNDPKKLNKIFDK